ncbi:EamA family transporter [Actinophytocola sediminis]
MGALFALASAVSYGLSDFLGGVLSRRGSFVRVALFGQLGGLVSMACVAPFVSVRVPAFADVVWGGLSGVGTGLAMMFLFRGMSRGAVSIVVPTSAIGGVTLPVLVGVAVLGERPAPLAWVGIALALPALWWVSRGRAGDGRGVGDGLIASVGIAAQYLALAQAGPESGIWPVVAGRVVSIIAVAVASTAMRRDTVVPDGAHRVGGDVAAGVAGALAGFALVCYLYATRTELVAIAVVLSSLYPGIPVLLGITVLGERLTRSQAAGLIAAAAATVLIATA